MGNICITDKSVANSDSKNKQVTKTSTKCSKSDKCKKIKLVNKSTETENNVQDKSTETESNDLIPIALSEDEQCIVKPNNSDRLLNMLTQSTKLYNSYTLCFNFNITEPHLPVVLNWTKDYMVEELFMHPNMPNEIHNIHNQKIGITIYQGDEYNVPSNPYEYMSDDPNVDLEKPKITYRKLWLKCYNREGYDYWPECSYVPLGTHNVNKIIKLTIKINNMGIQAHMNDPENSGTVLTESSGTNKGFIFDSLNEEPDIIAETADETGIGMAQGVGMSNDTQNDIIIKIEDTSMPSIEIADDSIHLVSMKLFTNLEN